MMVSAILAFKQGVFSRYFANIIGRLPESFVPVLTTCNNDQLNLPVHPNLRVFKYKRFRPTRISGRIERLYFDAIDFLKDFDLLHPTYYFTHSENLFSRHKYPIILTVHDMTHEVFSDLMEPLGETVKQKQEAIHAADAIICISENTKRDLLDRYSIPEKRIKVIHLASELEMSMAYGPEKVPARPYFLYVGMRLKYKNFIGLLDAFAKVASSNSEAILCIVGSPFSDAESRIISELKLTDRIEHYGFVADRHLAKLYRCSVGFVYPSLYEGFGIPPLEAMACGAPVIACRSSSIPEVVGDAALLFAPDSNDDLVEALLLLLNHPGERACLIDRGFERAKMFSWDRTAEKTIEIYRSFA